MSLNRIIAIFGIILVLFAGFIFFQFSTKTGKISKLPTAQVTINGNTFKAEVAETPIDREVGLSKHDSLPNDQGMLFIFDKSDYYVFWMKSLKFPLDIIYIANNKIVTIIPNAPKVDLAKGPFIQYQPDMPSESALEINAGLSKQYNFKKGDSVTIEKNQ